MVTGDASVSSRLLENHFDLIFFTGSPSIGKIVYRAATKFLTPCVMELGGKKYVCKIAFCFFLFIQIVNKKNRII